jgi:hypothetical protein
MTTPRQSLEIGALSRYMKISLIAQRGEAIEASIKPHILLKLDLNKINGHF